MYVLSWGQWKPMMVLKPGQSLKGLWSGVKSSINLGMCSKCRTIPPSQHLGWGVSRGAVIPVRPPSKETKIYPVLAMGGE